MGWARKKLRQLDKAIIRPVLNTVEGIIEDPKKLAMVALSVFAPGVGSAIGGAMGLSGTAAAIVGNTAVNTVLNGGDIKSAIIAAAIPVVGKEMAGIAANSFVEAGMDKALAETAGNVTSRSLLSAAQGKDPINALVTGGLSAGTDAVLKEIPGFDDLDPSLRKMATKAVTNTLAGNAALSPQDAINAALNIGMKAVDKTTDEEGNLIEGYFKPGGAGYIPPEELEATVKPDADAESAFLRQMNPYLAQQQDAEKTNFKEPESSITEPTEVGQIPFDPVSLLTELPTETPPAAPPVETPVEPPVETKETDWNSIYKNVGGEGVDESNLSKLSPEDRAKYEAMKSGNTSSIDDLMKIPGQEMQIDPKNWESYNNNLIDIVNNKGGYTSQWQTVGNDRVMVNDDGTGIGTNENGDSYALTQDQVNSMIKNGVLNTAGSGYVAATGGTGNTPGGSAKAPAPPATPAKPATPGAKTPATGKNPAVDAITNIANQQQDYRNSVLNMMMNDKAGVANIKSFKDLYGDSLFGDTYVPPSALGNAAGFAQQPQFQSQDNDVEDFFKGGDVTDINTLLQILRG